MLTTIRYTQSLAIIMLMRLPPLLPSTRTYIGVYRARWDLRKPHAIVYVRRAGDSRICIYVFVPIYTRCR